MKVVSLQGPHIDNQTVYDKENILGGNKTTTTIKLKTSSLESNDVKELPNHYASRATLRKRRPHLLSSVRPYVGTRSTARLFERSTSGLILVMVARGATSSAKQINIVRSCSNIKKPLLLSNVSMVVVGEKVNNNRQGGRHQSIAVAVEEDEEEPTEGIIITIMDKVEEKGKDWWRTEICG